MSDEPKVVRLVPKGKREPWPEQIEFLAQLLEQAKRGEISGLAVVATYDDDSYTRMVFHGSDSNATLLVGGLEVMKASIIARRWALTNPPEDT
jgi:hypothetical protein